MHQSDYDWPEVRRNIGKARYVWGILGVILRRKGVNHITSALFYRVVVQAALFFGAET